MNAGPSPDIRSARTAGTAAAAFLLLALSVPLTFPASLAAAATGCAGAR